MVLEASLERIITRYDVMGFSMLTGDYNCVHVDSGVVHGLLLASYISTLIGMKLPGNGAIISSMNLKFLSPTHIGDRITISGKIVRESPAAKAIVVAAIIRNSDKVLVEAEVTVRC